MKIYLLTIGLIMNISLTNAQLSNPLVIKTEKIFNDLTIEKMELLKNFYAQDIKFNDPLTSISGLETLTAYYANLYKNVKKIEFIFHDAIVNDNNIMVTWTMNYEVDSLNDGNVISVIGNSHIKFNEQGLAVYHRDYFDVAQMVYEYVPVLGWVIKKVKNRLTSH